MPDKDISPCLLEALNEGGAPFQEAVNQKLITSSRKTGWDPKSYNYPVDVNGAETKVDIVLEKGDFIATIECKRVNPSQVAWLFAAPNEKGLRSIQPFIPLASTEDPRRFGMVLSNLGGGRIGSNVEAYRCMSWTDVSKGKRRRNGRLGTSQSIEDAIRQTLLGATGIAREQLSIRERFGQGFLIGIVPVVVTTAELYVASYSIDDVNLNTGTLDTSAVEFGPGDQPESVPYLLAEYDVGGSIHPNLLHPDWDSEDLTKLARLKQRSVFIVNSSNLTRFFSTLTPEFEG